MGKSICSVEDCERPVHGRRLCLKHYRRWKRHGDSATVLINRHEGDAEQRFWAKVARTETCWTWTSAVSSSGYGNYFVDGRYVLAHRYVLELRTGETVSGDLHVDHRCHNKLCVRPAHLRIATPSQNNENYPPGRVRSRSGVRGVSWYPQRGMWRARVQRKGKTVYSQLFSSLEEAEAAAIAQRNRFHTHNDADRKAS